jgi:hypothetical protein
MPIFLEHRKFRRNDLETNRGSRKDRNKTTAFIEFPSRHPPLDAAPLQIDTH